MTRDGRTAEAGTTPCGRWRDEAACSGQPLATFFPDPYCSQTPAKAFCQGCAVRVPCLLDAFGVGEQFGIRGGFNLGDQRTRKRARQWLKEHLKVSCERDDDTSIDLQATA